MLLPSYVTEKRHTNTSGNEMEGVRHFSVHCAYACRIVRRYDFVISHH